MRRTISAIALVMLLASRSGAQDAFDLSTASIVNAPADVASWPATATISKIAMQPKGAPLEGLALTFDAQDRWPDYVPPGWAGPLQYTVWACTPRPWVCSGFIQMWRGRPNTGAPILSDFAINWDYDARWGAMSSYRPSVGDSMAFFVTAGNARGEFGVTSLRERSNVVLVPLPAGDTGVFNFAPIPPKPEQTPSLPIVVPEPIHLPPVVIPEPAPSLPVDPPATVTAPPATPAPVPPSPHRALHWWEGVGGVLIVLLYILGGGSVPGAFH